MSEQQPPDPKPPVILFLPGLAASDTNSAGRIAELMAAEADLGPGKYSVEAVDADVNYPHLADGRRIVRTDGATSTPMVDVYTVEYRNDLDPIASDATGVRRTWLALTYVVHAARPLIGFFKRHKNKVRGWKNAKGRKAKLQLSLGLGFVAAFLLVVAMIGSIWTLFSAADVTDDAPTTWAAAWKLGLTALLVLAVTKIKSLADRTTPFIRQMIEHTQKELHASKATRPLRVAIDALLEEDANRQIHLVAHSFGSLVAFDFLYPRVRLLQATNDPRYRSAIKSLITMGCPIDVIRLYEPKYLVTPRSHRIPNLKWINVFIPADIFGSNLPDRAIQDISVKSVQFTDEELTLLTPLRWEGIASHNDYFRTKSEDNCLHLVNGATWLPEQQGTEAVAGNVVESRQVDENTPAEMNAQEDQVIA